jgi:hypothetical protein
MSLPTRWRLLLWVAVSAVVVVLVVIAFRFPIRIRVSPAPASISFPRGNDSSVTAPSESGGEAPSGSPPTLPAPGPPGGGAFVSDSHGSGPEAAAPSSKNQQGTEQRILRYPNIEAPNSVISGQDFAVQVSLTAAQIDQGTRIVQGQEQNGQLVLSMKSSETSWQVEVDLTAPGFELRPGSANFQTISVPREGDSTIALFHLRANPVQGSSEQRQLYASLYRDDAFIGRLERAVTVNAAAVDRTEQAAEPAVPAASAFSTPARPSAAPSKASLAIEPPQPTITIEEIAVPPNLVVLIHADGWVGPTNTVIPDIDDIHKWVESRYAAIGRAGRGLSPAGSSAPTIAADVATGFGNDLYDRYAPQVFRDIFWRLRDRQVPIRSIQIISNDPVIPWELMRPARDNSGNDRQDFLGLNYAIARFPSRTSAFSSPPAWVTLHDLAIIAPHYQGSSALQGTSGEVAAIRAMYSGSPPVGDYNSVRALIGSPPMGIIHFAGHGAIRSTNGVPEFVILLEDNELDPSTWRSLLNRNSRAHPLYFFNACDVGQAQVFINEVEGWAPVLLDSGASGYIGALWPVSDQVASKFAEEFYQGVHDALLAHSKADIAQILSETRQHVYDETRDPTALAYVFYGNPELELLRPKSSAQLSAAGQDKP